jgi:molecular chaperone Hsp33
MNNNDLIQRFVFEDADVRGEIVRLNLSYKTIIAQHPYPPFIQKLLGETLAVATLISAVIKFKGRLTVQFQGKGGLKLLLAQCDDEYHIRGLVQWQPELMEETLLDAFQNGVLAIIMQGEKGNQRYQGTVRWQGNSLAECIEGYFRDSEQLPTRLWLNVNEQQAVGLLLQVMPSTVKSAVQEALPRYLQDWEQIIHLTETMTAAEFQQLDTETLLRRLYSFEHELRLFPPDPVTFHCTCSQSRSETALLLLGKEEVEEELTQKQAIVVTCDFCNQEYKFDRVDVERIFKQQGGAGSTRVH